MKQPFEGSEGYINHGHDVLDEDNALGKRRRFNNEGCEPESLGGLKAGYAISEDACGIAVDACDGPCCG